MAVAAQPILCSVLGHIYEDTFGCLDHEDLKEERSAAAAMTLMSANFRATNNPYYISKLLEVWESVKARDNKWTDDLWYPALASFAYDDVEMDRDDATKVLKNFMKIWGKNHDGAAKNVSISNIITLKKGLVASGIHLSHDFVFKFLITACPVVHILPADTSDVAITRTVEKLVSKTPNHLPKSLEDPLLYANNYFILKHYKACQIELFTNVERMDQQMGHLERSNRVQEYIMRQVTSHHDLNGIFQELGVDPNSSWEASRGMQMNIVRAFINLSRARFFARFPTAALFSDIDQQIITHGVDTGDLVKQNITAASGGDSWGLHESDDDYDIESPEEYSDEENNDQNQECDEEEDEDEDTSFDDCEEELVNIENEGEEQPRIESSTNSFKSLVDKQDDYNMQADANISTLGEEEQNAGMTGSSPWSDFSSRGER